MNNSRFRMPLPVALRSDYIPWMNRVSSSSINIENCRRSSTYFSHFFYLWRIHKGIWNNAKALSIAHAHYWVAETRRRSVTLFSHAPKYQLTSGWCVARCATGTYVNYVNAFGIIMCQWCWWAWRISRCWQRCLCEQSVGTIWSIVYGHRVVATMRAIASVLWYGRSALCHHIHCIYFFCSCLTPLYANTENMIKKSLSST